MTVLEKACNSCGKLLPLTSFYKDKKGGKYGVRGICIPCFNKQSRDIRRTKEGLIFHMYHQQKQNSSLRGHVLPCYTREELSEWLSNQPKFHLLYDNWVKSGFNKWECPSCDRISSLKPYTFGNLQIGSLLENLQNENLEMKKGLIGGCVPVIGISKYFGNIKYYVSQRDAERKTGVQAQSISKCCLGKCKSAGGYIWRFAS